MASLSSPTPADAPLALSPSHSPEEVCTWATAATSRWRAPASASARLPGCVSHARTLASPAHARLHAIAAPEAGDEGRDMGRQRAVRIPQRATEGLPALSRPLTPSPLVPARPNSRSTEEVCTCTKAATSRWREPASASARLSMCVSHAHARTRLPSPYTHARTPSPRRKRENKAEGQGEGKRARLPQRAAQGLPALSRSLTPSPLVPARPNSRSPEEV